jgi:TIR domain
MSSLADIPELIGFFSYSRDDDEDAKGALSALRDRILRDLGMQLGRGRSDLRLWQDKTAIPHGTKWEEEIKTAITQSVFFIPIVTPRSLRSKHCKYEFDLFLAREAELERRDLIFPILYVRVPALEDERQWRNDDVLSVIGSRQYLNWLSMRFVDVDSYDAAREVDKFCANIYGALNQPWTSPAERRESAAAEAAQRQTIEEIRFRQAEEATAQAAERRRAVARAAQAAEEERRRTEAPEKTKTTTAEPALPGAAIAATTVPAAPEIHAADASPATRATAAPAPSAAWFDVKSWSYIKIAIAAVPFGIIAGWPNTTAAYLVHLGAGTHLLSVYSALYAAAILLLGTKLTANRGFGKLALAFLGLCILFGLSNSAIQAIVTAAAGAVSLKIPVAAATTLLLWVVVAGTFLSLRDAAKDQQMLAIALATGAAQGIEAAVSFATLPWQTAFFSTAIFVFCTTAVMLAYGIRRHQSLFPRNLLAG